MTLGLLGGMDPTGGAGLLRDAWAAAAVAPDATLSCVATALTVQGDGERARSFPVAPSSFVERLAPLDAAAVIKVGVLPASLGLALHEWLGRREVFVVLDPVLHASDGGALGGSVDAYALCCGPRTILTPNINEARRFVGDSSLEGETLVRAVAAVTGAGVVLLKGGHAAAAAATIVDFVLSGHGVERVERTRVQGPEIRGTGCALAAAIAGYLWRGVAARDAVLAGVRWLDDARTTTRQAPDGRWYLSAV